MCREKCEFGERGGRRCGMLGLSACHLRLSSRLSPTCPLLPPVLTHLPTRSKQIEFGMLSAAEIMNTAELHVYERALYKVCMRAVSVVVPRWPWYRLVCMYAWVVVVSL